MAKIGIYFIIQPLPTEQFEEFLAKDKVELASGRSQSQTPEMKLYPPKIKTTK